MSTRGSTARTCLFLATVATSIAPAAANAEPDPVLVFSYFIGNGEDGLHLAWSEDGLEWTALRAGKSCLAPTVGKDRLMRDPSIVQGPDGTFHMVWTSSWTDRIVGYAHSKDLIEWSPQRAIPVMMHEPEARNSWAPELFFDRASGEFWIIWSTTIRGRFADTAGSSESDYNHRMYSTTTRDFESFTPTKLFFDPGYDVIDGFLATEGKRYLLFYKDERKFPEAKKDILLATSESLAGPWKVPTKPISPRNWVEGPSVVRIDDDWIVYFDAYTRHRYEAVRSNDLETWTDITDRIRFPEGARHGTVLKVSRNVLDTLRAHFDGSRGRAARSRTMGKCSPSITSPAGRLARPFFNLGLGTAYLNAAALSFVVTSALMLGITWWRPLEEPRVLPDAAAVPLESAPGARVAGLALVAATVALYLVFW